MKTPVSQVVMFRVPLNGVILELTEEQAKAVCLASDQDWFNSQNALRRALSWTPPTALIEIEKRVCAFFARLPHELHTASREQHIAWPRQLVMFYAALSAGVARQDIARFFDRSYDTVRHSVEVVADTFSANKGTEASLSGLSLEIETLCAQWKPAELLPPTEQTENVA